MGVMAEIDMARELALNEASCNYLEVLEDYHSYMFDHPPARRTSAQAIEVSRLEELVTLAKYKYDAAKENRYRV